MKVVYIVLGLIAIGASIGMYIVGSGSSHLDELLQFFWIPLPLGVLLLIMGAKQK